MLPDRVSNPGPLTYETGALPIALRGPAICADVLEWFDPQKITLSIICNQFADLTTVTINKLSQLYEN